eukprot:Nk52_evm1s1822 gene=Nk52_evmTU1s1822
MAKLEAAEDPLMKNADKVQALRRKFGMVALPMAFQATPAEQALVKFMEAEVLTPKGVQRELCGIDSFGAAGFMDLATAVEWDLELEACAVSFNALGGSPTLKAKLKAPLKAIIDSQELIFKEVYVVYDLPHGLILPWMTLERQ